MLLLDLDRRRLRLLRRAGITNGLVLLLAEQLASCSNANWCGSNDVAPHAPVPTPRPTPVPTISAKTVASSGACLEGVSADAFTDADAAAVKAALEAELVGSKVTDVTAVADDTEALEEAISSKRACTATWRSRASCRSSSRRPARMETRY